MGSSTSKPPEGPARRLRVRDIPAVLHARLLLAATAAGLRFVGYRRTRSLLVAPPRPRRGGFAADPEHVAHLVAVAARLGLRRPTCLPRSIVLQRLLARRGVAAELRLGVATDGAFAAHAWVEVDGRAVGEADPERCFHALRGGDP